MYLQQEYEAKKERKWSASLLSKETYLPKLRFNGHAWTLPGIEVSAAQASFASPAS